MKRTSLRRMLEEFRIDIKLQHISFAMILLFLKEAKSYSFSLPSLVLETLLLSRNDRLKMQQKQWLANVIVVSFHPMLQNHSFTQKLSMPSLPHDFNSLLILSLLLQLSLNHSTNHLPLPHHPHPLLTNSHQIGQVQPISIS